MTRTAVVFAVAAGLALAGCGESKQDNAQSQVCSARADIRKQVDSLTGMTASTFTVDAVQSSLKSIRDDLQQIADAQGDLSGDRKQQVQQAASTFKSSIESIAGSLLKSVSAGQAEQQLKAAATQLKTSFEQALQPLDCSD